MKSFHSLIVSFFLVFIVIPEMSHGQNRSLWVTRWDYESADDVIRIMENCQAIGVKNVIFQVRGNATVFYPSKIEPWGWELTGDSAQNIGMDPGWDPLQTAIDEAHKRGMELHAWMNLFPGWRGLESPPAKSNHIWLKHRSWFIIDQKGVLLQPTRSFYAFLSPGNPSVRQYLASLFGEVAKNYPSLDEIHMDYVRYPAHNEVSRTIRDFSYDKVSVAAFRKIHKKYPQYDMPEWMKFKCDQVSSTIRAVRLAILDASPTMRLSSTCMAEINRATSEVGQEPREWLSEGLVDWIIPMAYKRDTAGLEETLTSLDQAFDSKYKQQISVGLNIDFNSTSEVRRQMALVSQRGYSGQVLFAYSSLFQDHKSNGKAVVVENIWRQEQLKELLLSKESKSSW